MVTISFDCLDDASHTATEARQYNGRSVQLSFNLRLNESDGQRCLIQMNRSIDYAESREKTVCKRVFCATRYRPPARSRSPFIH